MLRRTGQPTCGWSVTCAGEAECHHARSIARSSSCGDDPRRGCCDLHRGRGTVGDPPWGRSSVGSRDDDRRGPIALFGLILLLMGPNRAAADLPSVRQDVRQRGSNPRNAQQTVRDNQGVIVAGDYIAAEKAAAKRPTTQRLVENGDPSRRIAYPDGRVWWRLTGWMLYPTTTRPSLRFQPYCVEDGTRMLVETQRYRSYSFSDDLDIDEDTTALRCPDPSHNKWELYHHNLHTVRERVRSLLENASQAGGWDRSSAEDITYS